MEHCDATLETGAERVNVCGVVVVLGRDFHASGSGTTATAAPTTAAPTTHTAAGAGPTTTTGPPANPGGAMPVAGC